MLSTDDVVAYMSAPSLFYACYCNDQYVRQTPSTFIVKVLIWSVDTMLLTSRYVRDELSTFWKWLGRFVFVYDGLAQTCMV